MPLFRTFYKHTQAEPAADTLLLFRSLSPRHSLCLSSSLSVSLSLSLSLALSVSLSWFLDISLPLSLCHSLFHSLPLPVCLLKSVSLCSWWWPSSALSTHCISPSLSLSHNSFKKTPGVSFSLFLALFLLFSLSLVLLHLNSVCVFLCLSLSFYSSLISLFLCRFRCQKANVWQGKSRLMPLLREVYINVRAKPAASPRHLFLYQCPYSEKYTEMCEQNLRHRPCIYSFINAPIERSIQKCASKTCSIAHAFIPVALNIEKGAQNMWMYDLITKLSEQSIQNIDAKSSQQVVNLQ